jgi:hypothetical protein
MDYARIYREFIADRLEKSPRIIETHHIAPVSLGGSDDQANLIALSPEDHFFAHLLLAKIHGGPLWVPVVMWLGGDRRNWQGRRSRLAYGWAVRAARRATSGRGAHQYDHTVYSLEHSDGRRFSGTQAEMPKALGISRAGANLLIKRKLPSMGGWFFPGHKPQFVGRGSRKANNHPMLVATKLHFRHRDGRQFFGTQFEMHRLHGLSKTAACTLASGKRTISKGWYVVGREPSSRGRAGAYKAAAEPIAR